MRCELARRSPRQPVVGTPDTPVAPTIDAHHDAPCRANSVRAPRPDPCNVRPWSADNVYRIRVALPEQCRAPVDAVAGCGLRQGEIFALGLDEIDVIAAQFTSSPTFGSPPSSRPARWLAASREKPATRLPGIRGCMR